MKLFEALEILEETDMETLVRAMQVSYITPAEIELLRKTLEQVTKSLAQAERLMGAGAAAKLIHSDLTRRKTTTIKSQTPSNPVNLNNLRMNLIKDWADMSNRISEVETDASEMQADLAFAKKRHEIR